MTCSPKERTLWKLNIISTRQAITPPAPARPAACIVLNMPDATKLFGFKLNDYEENVYTLTTGHQLIRRNGTETNCRKKFYQSRSSAFRSEEHTSELQSRQYLVCRLLLEKKQQTQRRSQHACKSYSRTMPGQS